MTICKTCATGADIRKLNENDWSVSACSELHAICRGLTHCDCQHYIRPGVKIIPLTLSAHYPPRCSVCYRRTALTRVGGVIHWHKTQTPMGKWGGTCPGSGRPDLVKATAKPVTSS